MEPLRLDPRGPSAPPPPREKESDRASSALARRREPYPWAWVASLSLHLLVVGGFLAASFLDGCGGPRKEEKPIVAKLVRLGTPRDERLLPRLPTSPPVPPASKPSQDVVPGKELAQPPKQEAPTPVPETKPTPVPVPEATPLPKEAPPQAQAPKNAPAAPNRLDDIMKRFATAERRGKAEELPGQLDGDPEGDAEEAAEGERYLALLQKRLRDHYVLPSTIPEAERIRLQALVRIHVQKNGTISDFRIEQSSGNAQYDGALESAVRKASPLPPPPEHLLRTYRDGFPVRFRY